MRHVDLRFERAPDGRTFLARQHVAWPFHVTRAFDYEGDPDGMATVVLQSVGGGLVQGDALALALACGEGARVHLTTQAATVAHAMAQGTARADHALSLAPRAWLEWLPDPLILLPGAEVEAVTTVTLGAGVTLMLADGVLGHDPEGARRAFRRLASTLELRDAAGALVALDRFAVEGAALAAGLPGVNGAMAALGTFVVVPGGADASHALDALVAGLDGLPGTYAGASLLPGGIGAVARILAADGATLRAAMSSVWRAARVALGARPPLPRRK